MYQRILNYNFVNNQMEYSFSQTFGRGAIALQNSPPSRCSSNINASQNRYRSKSRSISLQTQKQKSLTKGQYSKDIRGNQYERKIYIQHDKPVLKRQIRSYSHMPKYYDNHIHKQRQMQMKDKIKNVEGINQRMINLIKSLKGDYIGKQNKSYIKQDYCQKGKSIDKRQNQKIQVESAFRGNRSSTVKKLNRFEQKYIKEVQNQGFIQKQQIFYTNKPSSKNYLNKFESKQKKFDERQRQSQKQILYKNQQKYLIQQKNSKNKYKDKINKDNFDQIKYENNVQLYRRLNNLKGKIYTSQMYQSNNNSHIHKQIFGSYQQTNTRLNKNKHYQIPQERQFKKDNNLLKNKVKTIQSEVETNCFEYQDWDKKSKDQIQQISIVEQKNFQIKERSKQQQEQESICMVLFDETKKKLFSNLNCGNQIQSKTTSNFNSNYNANTERSGGLEQKLQRISQKIQNYQKKVSQLKIDPKIQFSSKMKNNLDRNNYQLKNQLEIYNPRRKQIERLYTPTWRCEEFQNIQSQIYKMKQKNEGQSKDKSLMSKNMQTGKQIFRKQDITETNQRLNRQSSRQYLNKNVEKKEFSHNIFPQITNNLKERMNAKLGLSKQSERLTKQIQLDMEFRKSKKQFSKLPQQFQGVDKSKWKYLLISIKSQIDYFPSVLAVTQLNQIKQIFDLTDDEADPFYSISVQNLRDYQQVIDEAATAYLRAEQYFSSMLSHKLSKDSLIQVFKDFNFSQQLIKLDQFTVSLSNATKNNYKCRDVFLLYSRIKKSLKLQLNNSIKIKDIIQALSPQQVGKKQSLAFQDSSSNIQAKTKQFYVNLDTQKKKNHQKQLDMKVLSNNYPSSNKENFYIKRK